MGILPIFGIADAIGMSWRWVCVSVAFLRQTVNLGNDAAFRQTG